MVKINNLTIPRADETTEQLKFLTTVDESRKWYNHFESLTTSHTFKYIPTPNIEILGNSPKEMTFYLIKIAKKKKSHSIFIRNIIQSLETAQGTTRRRTGRSLSDSHAMEHCSLVKRRRRPTHQRNGGASEMLGWGERPTRVTARCTTSLMRSPATPKADLWWQKRSELWLPWMEGMTGRMWRNFMGWQECSAFGGSCSVL